MRKQTDAIIINGYAVPAPDFGFSIDESTYGDFGRNANNAVTGQVIGRNLWKINNLQWSDLTPEEWKALKTALKPFFVMVTFTTDENEQITIEMYPSDRSSQPMKVDAKTNKYGHFKTCKFNLIDCGK